MRLDSNALLLLIKFYHQETHYSILSRTCFKRRQNACLRCLFIAAWYDYQTLKPPAESALSKSSFFYLGRLKVSETSCRTWQFCFRSNPGLFNFESWNVNVSKKPENRETDVSDRSIFVRARIFYRNFWKMQISVFRRFLILHRSFECCSFSNRRRRRRRWRHASATTTADELKVVAARPEIKMELLSWVLFLSAAIGQRPRNYLSCCSCCSCSSCCSLFGSFPH